MQIVYSSYHAILLTVAKSFGSLILTFASPIFAKKNGGHDMLGSAVCFQDLQYASAGGSLDGLVGFLRTAGIDLRRRDISFLPAGFTPGINHSVPTGLNLKGAS
jgi:hypothetical protein